jgi:Ca2+-transporting ATPase
VFVRGVSESVLARCDEIWDHGHIRRLSARDRQRISQELPEATQTIALAYRMLPAATKLKSLSKDQAESKLTWIGLVSLEDPVKPGVPAAMAAARRLRLRVNIVTSAQSQSANSLNPDGQAVAVADSHTDFPTLVAAILASRASVQNLKTAAFSCLTASAAVLIVVLASLATALAFQLPPALSVMQILAISLLAALPPATALAWEKSDPSRQPQHNHPRQLSLARASASIFWCGLLIGGLAFANYLWVFARNHVDPGGLGAASLIHQKATTLAFLTIVLCQLAVVLQYRSRQGLFTRYQLHNKKLWLALAFSLACTLAIIYVPFLSPFFGASSLGLTSWLSALAATVLFILIREFQRYEQQHHRHVVLKLHQASQQKPAS